MCRREAGERKRRNSAASVTPDEDKTGDVAGRTKGLSIMRHFLLYYGLCYIFTWNAIDECNGMVQVEIEIGYQTVLRDVGCTPSIAKETIKKKAKKKKKKKAQETALRDVRQQTSTRMGRHVPIQVSHSQRFGEHPHTVLKQILPHLESCLALIQNLCSNVISHTTSVFLLIRRSNLRIQNNRTNVGFVNNCGTSGSLHGNFPGLSLGDFRVVGGYQLHAASEVSTSAAFAAIVLISAIEGLSAMDAIHWFATVESCREILAIETAAPWLGLCEGLLFIVLFAGFLGHGAFISIV